MGVPRTLVHTTLYDLIAAVRDAIAPGEEGEVTPMVVHLLHAGHAPWLRPVEVEMLWDAHRPESLHEEATGVPA
jgi:hypothetical protein